MRVAACTFSGWRHLDANIVAGDSACCCIECLKYCASNALLQGRDAKEVRDRLAQAGIMVRHYAKKELSGYIRISVGKPEQTDLLMAAIRAL